MRRLAPDRLRIRMTRLTPGTIADCEQCALDPDSTRRQVRAHVRDTGHTVRVLVEEVTKYEPENSEDPE